MMLKLMIIFISDGNQQPKVQSQLQILNNQQIMMSLQIRTKLKSTFNDCVSGFHVVNTDPIKEAPWESLNALIFNESGIAVDQEANGNHRPGADLFCSLGGISNKSAKYDIKRGTGNNDSFKISSYRLTSVCSENNVGTSETVLDEINKRKNFEYYSVIVRSENDEHFAYDWYMIPSDHSSVNPNLYEWSHKIGKSGKGKGSVTGWETNVVDGSSMHIQFSMSSQLWMTVNITEDMKQEFIVGSMQVSRVAKYNYLDIHRMCNGGMVDNSPISELDAANIMCTFKSSEDSRDVSSAENIVPGLVSDLSIPCPPTPTPTPVTTPNHIPYSFMDGLINMTMEKFATMTINSDEDHEVKKVRSYSQFIGE
jgi:hypothetical protein